METRPNISRTPRQGPALPPCRVGCPSGTDVRGWLAVVAQRSKFGYSESEALERAWNMIVERNPFPATMGRICPHPCEAGCNRAEKDGAVAVNEMERFLGDWAIQEGLRLPRSSDYLERAETVASVGSGPAGLSFAYQMARRGYAVTIYERSDAPGGMLRFGIPDYRLPRSILDSEIERILDLGVELNLGVRIGEDLSPDQLRDRHEAVFLGVGASLARRLGIEGEDGPHVVSGVDFLEACARKEPPVIGDRVIVVGGGNTAIDAARTARRRGADVTILYRRTRMEMPANEAEIDECLEEGVRIEFLTAPVAIRRLDDGIRAVEVVRMELGKEDDTGRRRPVALAGTQYEVPADTVIVAVAQAPDWRGLEIFGHDGQWAPIDDFVREELGYWAGGDVTGAGIASSAIGHGRAAAERVHARLQGLPLPSATPENGITAGDLNLDYYRDSERVQPSHASPDERIRKPDLEVSSTISRDEFLAEASRCLSCGMCIGCSYCYMFCNADGFARVLEPRPGEHFVLLLDRCESCGKCIEVCPCGFLSLDPGS